MAQKDQVLKMLKDAGKEGVTSSQFYKAYLPRFGARIWELRNDGHNIETSYEGKSRSGHMLSRYNLRK